MNHHSEHIPCATSLLSLFVASHTTATTVLAIVSIFALFFYRRQHPVNLICLSVFSLLAGLPTVHAASYVDSETVILALANTLVLFACLTVYAFFAKAESFSYLRSFMVTASIFSLCASLLSCFFFAGVPFTYTALTVLSLVIVSAGVIVDVRRIIVKYNSDDYVIACADLYLDLLRLFLQILKLMSKSKGGKSSKKDKKK
ncbi:hypothetical protein GEMRC1_013787 [Eukaryota sp. GEM-RC1]